MRPAVGRIALDLDDLMLDVDAIQDQPIPLSQDAHGIIRVANTRVTLDTVVIAFKLGASAEEIADRYDARLRFPSPADPTAVGASPARETRGPGRPR